MSLMLMMTSKIDSPMADMTREITRPINDVFDGRVSSLNKVPSQS